MKRPPTPSTLSMPSMLLRAPVAHLAHLAQTSSSLRGRRRALRQQPHSRPRSLDALLLPLLAAGLLAAGCAASGDESDQIKQLQERVLELQRKAAVSDVELARLRQQVAELTARSGSSATPASPDVPPAGLAYERSSRLTAPSPPLQKPSSRRAATSGSSSTAPAAAPPAVVETDIEVPAPRPVAPSGSAGRPAAAPPVSGRSATAAPPPGVGAPPLPSLPAAAPPGIGNKGEPATPAVQALYDRGYTLYHQKHYVDAETSFQRFLQAEPNSELADNAQYWIGECRYSRGDMRGALAAFREAVARYPEGNKTPDALLKAGMSLESLGDREGARNTYQEVLRRFPGTAVAAVAEERRAKLP